MEDAKTVGLNREESRLEIEERDCGEIVLLESRDWGGEFKGCRNGRRSVTNKK